MDYNNNGNKEREMSKDWKLAHFLKSLRRSPVVVKLNSGVDYRVQALCKSLGYVAVQALCKSLGYIRVQALCILGCLDSYMNVAMEHTEEYVNGELKNKYGDAVIRGNNVLYISNSKRTPAEGA
ncbi:unnamed protein product [Lupinus luteus]|uniref:Sm domain-containing protein n=1 Tax=Lupinus luteus TaxID=3873 RepID=A0AAV1Y6Z3_LUPLU